MKYTIALLFALCLSAHGQAVRNNNGLATTLTFYGNNNRFEGDLFTEAGFTVNNGIEIAGSHAFTTGAGLFAGNGAGLTNLAGLSNVTIINVSGKATFTQTNVVFKVIDFTTNSHPSSGNISLTNSWGAFATNNNTTFDNLAGIDAGATNIQSVMLTITNSSAAAKTIVMNARFQNMKPEQSNTLFVTNVAQLLVYLYPGFGTNFYFQSR